MTVRWPTGFMKPVLRPSARKPFTSPRAAVVLPRFCPVAARYRCRIATTGRPRQRDSAASAGLSLDLRDSVTQPRQRIGVDRIRLEVRTEPIEDVRHEPQVDRGIGHEELRLVVVADEREAALQDAPLLDMGNLRREVVALDAVG